MVNNVFLCQFLFLNDVKYSGANELVLSVNIVPAVRYIHAKKSVGYRSHQG